ncbi:complex I NDUFA9 subunit family protein [Sphingomonas sp. BIUV-7]|uniref:Complex I NDUFA9 subunit family protein n=1 Tax=Sphingomonas natans TaxID=3063330 RepID=A0ABT8Y7X8_9SPHN|nr:complex I NDUFA9 subunit family protein [Sphingomonas sp. BIUV-7]MDO6413998.1 complex I NDUFA9 subunit family protein [Sphingomonas sp. BIUV-7]
MVPLVTLFGGGGFLGRYVAQELLKTGARVRIAERDPSHAHFLKPQAGLGQTQFVSASITDPASTRRAVEGADAVINLVGVLAGDFQALHVEGARIAAEAAKAAGAKAFVQISAIGANASSDSAYGRSKAEGETAVAQAFPGATIIRPSILFGPEDAFVNKFAGMASRLPILPVIRGTVRFQPAWVADVAQAIALAALYPETHAGQTYELGGPRAISMSELNAWVSAAIGRKPTLVPVPDAVAAAMARFGGWLPGAPITTDQWAMLQTDNVVAPGASGFAAFGIEPKPLEAVAPSWLVRYRRQGRFSLNAPA